MKGYIKNRSIIKSLFLLCLIFISISFQGCRALYIYHLTSGQLRIITGSIPIQKALKENYLTSYQKYKLQLVDEIKQFGINALGLKATDSYSTVWTGTEREPIYIVAACPPDSLAPKTWWFPIAGRVPYLGFFDLNRAREEEKRLKSEGYDVFLGAGTAYSTLGWFKDPVTLNMLNSSIVELSDTILHEMTHNTIYIKGNSRFNEGLALMVGRVGAFLFLKEKFGDNHALTLYARDLIKDELRFSKLINQLIHELEECYGASISLEKKLEKKKVIFSRFQKRFRASKKMFKTDYFIHFGRYGLNNAYIAITAIYHRDFELFHSLYERNDKSMSKTLDFLRKILKSHNDPIFYLKTKFGSLAERK